MSSSNEYQNDAASPNDTSTEPTPIEAKKKIGYSLTNHGHHPNRTSMATNNTKETMDLAQTMSVEVN